MTISFCLQTLSPTSPTPTLWIVAALVYALVVAACLVDIARHPRDLLLTRRRWPWVVITIAIVPTGFALYLLFGRLLPEDLLPPPPLATRTTNG
ncbi:MAG: hypothetical protein U1E76_21755 [Planctomycetota bacterium]